MKHFTTADVQSFVLFSPKASPLTREVTQVLLEAMDLDCSIDVRQCLTKFDQEILWQIEGEDTYDESLLDFAHRFIFSDSRFTNPWSTALTGVLYPAQFNVLVGARKWHRAILKQCKNRSKEFYTRCGDFVYVNLNRGKSVVFIDGHHWVE